MPNPVHAHLLVNHLAPIATLLALMLLPWRSTFRASCLLVIVAALGAVAAEVTGDEAEPVVEGFHDTSEALIHDHKNAAERALPISVVAGTLAVVAALTTRRRVTSSLLIVATLASAACLLLAASTGGQIRHPEVRPGADLKQLGEPSSPEIEEL